MRELILGGARSGKSALAERRAMASGLEVVYLATGEALDGEMAERIEHHRARRPDHWRTVEEPLALAVTLGREAAPGTCIVVDCLTLWLANLLGISDQRLSAEIAALRETLPSLPGEILLVANEVGLGIVPDNPLARRFRDEAGRLNQQLGEYCERVTFVAAGLPLTLKEPEP